MNTRRILPLGLGALLAAPLAGAQSTRTLPALAGSAPAPRARFLPLGDLPGGTFESVARGISPGGDFVVGSSRSAAGTEAFLWSPSTGMVGLGDLSGGAVDAEAKGVSTDGAVVVGYGTTGAGLEAFRWSPATGMVGLGDLPGGADFSVATDVDAAGWTVVGYGTGAAGSEGFRWEAPVGMTGLGDLFGGDFASRALRISADGQVIVGDSSSSVGATACRWVGGGAPDSLHMNGAQYLPSSATAVSIAGRHIGGLGVEGFLPTAFVWEGGLVTDLGVLPYQTLSTLGLSNDGRRAVGTGWNGSATRAWIWDRDRGVRDLRAALIDAGIVLGGWVLENATDLSGDGQTLVGYGRNPQGRTEAFIAFLPIPCRADLDHDGTVDLVDLGIFSSAYVSQDPSADFDGDGFVTADDLDAFSLAYQRGCR